MSEFLQVTGGARVGWVNWSWPWGQLTAAPQELTVTTPFRTCYRFTPREVVALEPYGWVPVLWRGVRIVDGFVSWEEAPTPGPYTLLALALVFLTSVALVFSKTCQA